MNKAVGALTFLLLTFVGYLALRGRLGAYFALATTASPSSSQPAPASPAAPASPSAPKIDFGKPGAGLSAPAQGFYKGGNFYAPGAAPIDPLVHNIIPSLPSSDLGNLSAIITGLSGTVKPKLQ